MKRSIDYYISELLYIHDCVIIPGFGGFVGNHISAKLNKASNTLTPPSKQILFNENLKTNDGLLINYIADKESLDVKKIEYEVEKFNKNVQKKLNQIKNFRINKVGLFSLEEEGNLVFLQDSEINYSLETYGMSNIQTTSVSRVHITKELKESISVLTKKEKSLLYKKVWRAAAILIPLIGISLISITKQQEITNIYTQMAKLSVFNNKSSANIETSEITRNTTKIVTIKDEKVFDKKPIHVNKKITPSIKKEYHVIAGAFSSKQNAKNLILKLTSLNYNAAIIGTSKTGLIRVSYESYSTKEEALINLALIRRNNRSAWILSE